jgi:xylulokinase
MSLLGVEVGAAGCRALAISLDGVPLAQAYHEYAPPSGAGSGLGLDGHQVWRAAREVLTEIAAQTRHDPIRALSTAALGEILLPLSADGQAWEHTPGGTDLHSSDCPARMESLLGAQRLFDLTGTLPTQAHVLSRLCELRDHKPALFAGAGHFTFSGGLLSYLLGGNSTCDYSLAGGTLLFDMHTKTWSRELLAAANLPADILPALAPAGTPVGIVSSAVARELGLPPNVRLFLGGHQACCAALGAGVVHSGQALYNMGPHILVVPAFDAIPLTSLLLSQGLNMVHHVVPGLLVSMVPGPSGGEALRWFTDTLAPLEKRAAQKRGAYVYDELLAEMPLDPTPLLALPHLDPPSAGALLGLNLATTRGEIVKSLLEGMTFDAAEGQTRLEQVGIRLGVYRAAGAGARSERWLQLTADILGRPVERARILDAAPLGAALLAGVGSGAYASLEQAVKVVVAVHKRYEPDTPRHAAYQHKLARYRAAQAWVQVNMGG